MTKTKKKKSSSGWVKITNRGYGNILKGTKIYFEGKRPPNLRDDGSIGFGKNILQALRKQFPDNFKLILTQEADSITKKRKIFEVRVSTKFLDKMKQEKFSREADVKNDIVSRHLAQIFPDHFRGDTTIPYTPGALSKILGAGVSQKLSPKDKEVLNTFLPEYLQAESVSSVILKATTQIKSLKDLASDLEKEIKEGHPESWWQTHIKNKILIIQQGYIRAVEKMNISIGNTKFPDFSLVTHDGYLDILEIKKPDTPVLKYDGSRDNYFWDSEMSRAIIQIENYLHNISRYSDQVRSYIKDEYKIDLKVVRPRGIILVGNAQEFSDQKQKDDFRLLSQGSKNITILTYDELHVRLNNYIAVLEQHSKVKRSVTKKRMKSR